VMKTTLSLLLSSSRCSAKEPSPELNGLLDAPVCGYRVWGSFGPGKINIG
jgi:hypothetical protein